MSEYISVLHLQFRPGSNAQDAKSSAGSVLQQIPAAIANMPESQDSSRSCRIVSGQGLVDHDRFVLIVFHNVPLGMDKFMTALNSLFLPLHPYIISPVRTSVYAGPHHLRRHYLGSGVHELTTLRFPTRIGDLDEVFDDLDPRFRQGLVLLKDFGKTASWGIACDGPGDLIRQWDTQSVNEEQYKELLFIQAWSSEEDMRRFKDPSKGNAYNADPPTGFEQTPDDMWDRIWVKGLNLLRDEGVLTEGFLAELKMHY